MDWTDWISPAIVLGLAVFVYSILRDMKNDVGDRQKEMKDDLAERQSEMKDDFRELRENVVQVRERVTAVETLLTRQHPAE